VLIRTCGEYRVMAQRICGRTGVWTVPNGSIPEKKVAAIGVHVSQGVTSHGFALNVSPDMRDYQWIVPCGIADREVTSLELESPVEPPPTMEHVLNITVRNFGRVFQRQMIWAESLEQVFAGAPASVQ